MKKVKLILVLFSFVLCLLSPQSALCDNGGSVTVNTKKTTNDVPDLNPDDKDGRRMPSRPVIITITDGQGVMIPGVENEEVISYSIYTEDGILVAMYTDDIDFAAAVFTMTGTIEIRIALDGYALCGWMDL